MNCEEYREAIAADPSFDGGAGHLSECAACQAYRKDMLELDKAIAKSEVEAEIAAEEKELKAKFTSLADEVSSVGAELEIDAELEKEISEIQ